MDLTESTSQGPSVPSTIIPPTSTGFTPTVTRVITSVTESGTTERQRISINRVPYIAIAALRGETSYPGPLLQNGHPTVTADQRLFRPTTTTTTTVSFEHEFITNSSVEQNTIPVTTPTDHTLEKLMEVNRITLVTLKEELPVAYTRALSGNETTERMLVDEQSDKTMDKVSEVSRMKYVTVFGGSQTASPTIDTSRKTFTTLPTASRVPSETQYYENAIDTQGELQSGKPHYYNSTGSFKLGNVSTDSDAEPMVTSVTSKEAESTTIIDDDISSTDKPPTSISPLSNRRRQGSGRKPGVDYFKNRRISTSVSTIVSSTPSTFSHKSRGQRKRPRPYRPTSTTVPEEEAVELRSPDDSKVDNRTADTTRNTDPRRTFVPKRGQRRRPRPYVPSSTSADEVTNPVDNDGRENIVLVTEIADNATTGFIPKSGNRRRGTTPKPTTDNSKATSMTQIGESVNLKVADKGLKVLDTYDPSDNAESITRVVDAFIPENASRSVPTNGHGNASSPTEPNLKLKTADDIDVSTIKHSQTTESTIISETSPESEFNSESNVKYLSSGLNNAENGTHGNSTGVEETLKPTSLRAYTEESVTPPSTKSSDIASTTTGIWHGDRMRVKKRRRRPVTHILAPPETQTEPKSEEKTPSWNNLQATQNETKFTNSPAETDVSSSNPENNSVVTFATAALLGRDHYEVTSVGSVGDFAATGVREGKHMATPSVVNDPNSIAISRKTQKNKSAAITNTIIVNNVTLHDSSYDFQTSSHDSEQSIIADSDLSTDGSNYDLGRNSIYKPPASEEVHYSVLDSAVEFPNESHTEGTYHEKSEATINTSSRPGHRDFFIPSVDLASEPGDEQSLGSPAATGRVKPGSSSPEGKTRRLVRRKRPKITTEEPLVQSEVVTTTTRNLRRPTGALYNPNRLRQRSTTTTTTTTTTETPVSSTESEKDRRKPGTRLVRRRKYGPSANQTRDSDATASDAQPSDAPTDKDDSRGRVRKYSFPRRRANTTPPPPVTTTPVPVTTLPTNDTPGPGVERGEIQLLESNAQQPKDAEVQEESTTTKLPDLANSAVVAIHNLATVPPTSQASPEIFKSTRTISTTPRFSSTSSSTPATSSPPPRRASKVFPGEQSLPSSSGSASPRRLPDSVSARPRPFSKTTPSAAAAPATSARTSNARPKPTPVIDYEYYDDDDVGILDVAPISGKVKIHSDGYIECLDRGNFPHPFSCKKFISCAKMENGELLGWEYTCPRQLSFDPIGGICNWSAGLGCKE
ncbi:mucin-5AC-like [Zootermopsis nevadensis]|uniref:mucin-5AC-like n=1 Tax=Zootermopsis nevadensis TaxID=136037 RepID=UPI000B8E904C|nr:mucin-5AC-like [Zootermopsis nevadensis]